MESDREVLRPSEITKERVEAALKADKGSEAKMVSFAVQELTKAGENFVTFVVRVNVKFSSENGDDVVSYAVKYDPRRCKAVKDFILACFHKELVFYQNIVHDIQAQLHEIGLKPLRVPECFYTSLEENREVIFLEDISKKGFKKSEFEDGLDVAHTTLVLEELARLHAASYLLKAKIPDLAEKYPVLNLDWVTYADSARRNTQGLFGNIMDSASKLLRHIGGREVAVAWLEENKTRAAEIIEHELRREPLRRLCHGDCWNNNVSLDPPISEEPHSRTEVRGVISKLQEGDHLLKHQMLEQSGFTPGKSIIERILALRVITKIQDFGALLGEPARTVSACGDGTEVTESFTYPDSVVPN
nr:uncharacterized protein LOC113812606 [Penaeus vannamei]